MDSPASKNAGGASNNGSPQGGITLRRPTGAPAPAPAPPLAAATIGARENSGRKPPPPTGLAQWSPQRTPPGPPTSGAASPDAGPAAASRLRGAPPPPVPSRESRPGPLSHTRASLPVSPSTSNRSRPLPLPNPPAINSHHHRPQPQPHPPHTTATITGTIGATTTTSSPGASPPPATEGGKEEAGGPKVPPRTRPHPVQSPTPPSRGLLCTAAGDTVASSGVAHQSEGEESPSPEQASPPTSPAGATATQQQPQPTADVQSPSGASAPVKRVPPPRPSRVTVTAGRIDGWMRLQPPPAGSPDATTAAVKAVPVPPIPAKSLSAGGGLAEAGPDGADKRSPQSPTSPSSLAHRRSPSSGLSPSLLHVTPPPASSTASSPFSPPASSFSYFATSPRSPAAGAEQAGASSLSPRSGQADGGTLRERKGSFSTNILQNLSFWKKGSSPSPNSARSESKSAMSEVIRRGEPNRFLDALHKSKEDGDVSHPTRDAAASSSSSEGKREDTLRALQGLLFPHRDKSDDERDDNIAAAAAAAAKPTKIKEKEKKDKDKDKEKKEKDKDKEKSTVAGAEQPPAPAATPEGRSLRRVLEWSPTTSKEETAIPAPRSSGGSSSKPTLRSMGERGRSTSLPSISRRSLFRSSGGSAVPQPAQLTANSGSSPTVTRPRTATRHSFSGAPSRSVITPRSSPSSPAGSRVASPSPSPRSSSSMSSGRNSRSGGSSRPGSSGSSLALKVNTNVSAAGAGAAATTTSSTTTSSSSSRASGGAPSTGIGGGGGSQVPSGPIAIKEVDLVAPQKYLAQRWAQGKCKPGRAPRIKKLKASERKRAVVIVLDGEGITVLDANSQEVIIAHTFAQIKNWGHREGVKGMHFNYIATTGTKCPEIYDFKSDQALELFERISFQHALKLKESLARTPGGSRSLILASPTTLGSPGSGIRERDRAGEGGGKRASSEKTGTAIERGSPGDDQTAATAAGDSGEAEAAREQDKDRPAGRHPAAAAKVVVVVGGEREDAASPRASTAAAGERAGEGEQSANVEAEAARGAKAAAAGARRGAVQRLDKIRWSVLMEGPAVELVNRDDVSARRGREQQQQPDKNEDDDEDDDDNDDDDDEEDDDEDDEKEQPAAQQQQQQLLLSPRTMMARLEKKKSWQDITRNLKKFDFQSEKAKELREEREQREREQQAKKGPPKDSSRDDSGLLKAAKNAKKSLRVKTPKREEISIVRNDRPPSSEDGDQRTLSRGVSFDAKPGGKSGSREDLLRGSAGGDEDEEEDPEAEAEEDDVGRARKSGGEIDGSGIDHAGSGERRKVDMREEVVKELVKTEKKYVKDLEIIVEQYMRRLRENGLVEGPDIAAIFSNVDQIRNLNRTLFDSMEGLDRLPTEQSNVGERFLSFIEYLRLYTQYCSNQTQAGTRLKELKEAKPELHQLLEEMRDLPDINRLDLESFLIKPMQRLTRYPLFFQQLLKHTPETHPDYANLRKCLDGLHEVVTTINNQKQRNDNLNKLLLLQRQFLDTKEQPALKLVEATRKFIREGVFVKVTYGSASIKNCTVILFNDIIVLAVKKGKDPAAVYTPKSPKIPLAGLLVWDEKSVPFGFSVVGREAGQDKLTLQAGSEEEKASWVDEVNAALVHLPNLLRGHRRVPSAVGTVEKYIRHQEPPAGPQG